MKKTRIRPKNNYYKYNNHKYNYYKHNCYPYNNYKYNKKWLFRHFFISLDRYLSMDGRFFVVGVIW